MSDEPYDEEEFADCPAGKQVDEFHQRIVMGLVASLDSLEGRRLALENLPADERDDDQREFLSLYATVMERLVQVQDEGLPYDQRFTLATLVQRTLSEMDLLIDE